MAVSAHVFGLNLALAALAALDHRLANATPCRSSALAAGCILVGSLLRRFADATPESSRMSAPLIALTGATGFIGRHLLAELPKRGYRVRVLLRRPPRCRRGRPARSSAISRRPTTWRRPCAMWMRSSIRRASPMPCRACPRTITAPSTRKATHRTSPAPPNGRSVKRFVFLSSIRAQTGPAADDVLTEDGRAAPDRRLWPLEARGRAGLATLGVDWVALRPVLVYGPGVKGNMAALLRLARSPWPLPLGGLAAKRSLLSVDNLASAIDAVLRAPGPLRRPFIVADPEPVTVPEHRRRAAGRARPQTGPDPGAVVHAAPRRAAGGHGREAFDSGRRRSLVAKPGRV